MLNPVYRCVTVTKVSGLVSVQQAWVAWFKAQLIFTPLISYSGNEQNRRFMGLTERNETKPKKKTNKHQQLQKELAPE